MGNFLWGLLATVIGSLSFIAYKHPSGYEKLYRFLMPNAVFAALLLFVGWWAGMDTNARILLNESTTQPDETLADNARLITEIVSSFNAIYWLLGITAAAISLLLFLRYLHKILDIKPDAIDGGKF